MTQDQALTLVSFALLDGAVWLYLLRHWRRTRPDATLETEAAEAKADAERQRHVLFVDDDPQIVGILPSMECYGIKIDVARSGNEALQRLRANGYDAVVADIRMPGMTGLELCDHVKATHPEIRRIAYSAMGDSREVVAAFNRGALHHYLAKPWQNEQLIDVINEKTRDRRHP